MELKRLSPNQYLVTSDSGALYKVLLSGKDKSSISCGCKGFTFRRACKHVDAVKKQLKETGRSVKVKTIRDRYDYIAPYKKSMKDYLEALP